MQLTWLGHSAVHLDIAGRSVLIDPFWTGNPKHPEGFEDSLGQVDFIVLTHGHSDHLGDSARLARKYHATVVAIFEIVSYLSAQGIEKIEPMNLGGTVKRDGLAFTMVHALHSSAIVEDGKPVTMGDPAGFVIKGEGKSVYHAGDTEIFSDMALIQRIHQPKIGLIPIGDRFTMGPETAAFAVRRFLPVHAVIPCHYGSFPIIEPNADRFVAAMDGHSTQVIVPHKTVGVRI
jgi:L-ascorbate metabolism protein UlaG (beta-lactamase superfamily)